MKMFLLLLLLKVLFVQASELENKKRKRYYQNPPQETSLEEICLNLTNKKAINYIDTLSSDLLQRCASFLVPKETLNLKKTNKNMYSFKHQNGRKIERLPITGYHNIFENTGSIQVFRNVKNALDIKWEDPENLIPSVPMQDVKKFPFENCLRLPQQQRPNAIFGEVSKWKVTDVNTSKFMMKILFKILEKLTKRNVFGFCVETEIKCCYKIFITAVDSAARGEIQAMNDVKKVVEILSKSRTILQILNGRKQLEEGFVITNYVDGYIGWKLYFTLLTYAATRNQTEVVKILIQAGAKVDGQDACYSTALIDAARNGSSEMVSFLLKENANVNLNAKNWGTALITAASHGRTQTVKILLKGNANVNSQNEYGETALMKAVFWGRSKTIKVLLEAGAKIDIQDNNKETALMKAAYWGQFKTIKALLKANAKTDLQNNHKETALMMAAGWGSFAMVKALLEANAKIDLRNNKNQTAAMIANRRGYANIVALICFSVQSK